MVTHPDHGQRVTGRSRSIGGLRVAAVGFGAMVLSPGLYGDVDEREAEAALAAALAEGDSGASLLVDSSDGYGSDCHNERLLGRLLRGRRDAVVLSTKFGFKPPPGTERHGFPVGYAFGELAVNCSPELVRGYALASAARLGVDHLDLLYPHFPDPIVPLAETVGAMAELVAEGLVAHLGVSNVTAAQLAEAAAVHRITAVQVEWSMWKPIDPALLAVAKANDIGVVAWGPLGSGFLTGELAQVDPADYRANLPRLAGANLVVNRDRYAPVRGLAAAWGLTPARLALAWLLHEHEAVVPIPGSRRPAHIADNAAAADVVLDEARWAELAAAVAAFRPEGASLLPDPAGDDR